MCWNEFQLYGPSTVKQIIEGKHVRRGKVAHLITLEALFDMYLEAFYQCNNDDTHASIKQVADVLNKACEGGEKKFRELLMGSWKLLFIVNQLILINICHFTRITREAIKGLLLQFNFVSESGEFNIEQRSMLGKISVNM